MTRGRCHLIGWLLALAGTPAALAHAPSNATLRLAADGATVHQRWDVALRDLDRVLPLDADDDGRITWGELRQAWPQVMALADDGLHLAQPAAGAGAGAGDGAGSADVPCRPGPMAAPRIDDGHANGTHAVLERTWACPANVGRSGLVVDYRLFAGSDASHRGLLRWATPAYAAVQTAVLVPAATPWVLAGSGAHRATQGPAEGQHAAPSSLAGFVAEGVHHILIGTDHVLFLLALMLPAVVVTVRAGRHGGAPVSGAPAALRWPQAVWQVAQVVTAFTVAHSITLAMAVLGYADPPPRVVESLIAASVVLAAIDNLRRFLPGARPRVGAPRAGVPAPPAGRWWMWAPGAGVPTPPAGRVICRSGAAERWQIAFGFGLVHGFGFAGALRELGLESSALARSLLGFNLGVELGQLGIVALVMPLAWWARDTRFYRRVVLAGGSLAIALVATLWFIERAFDLALLTPA